VKPSAKAAGASVQLSLWLDTYVASPVVAVLSAPKSAGVEVASAVVEREEELDVREYSGEYREGVSWVVRIYTRDGRRVRTVEIVGGNVVYDESR
jgi:hypothetical protein